MKITLESDLHIEFGKNKGYLESGDVHVCAGDIGLLTNLDQLKRYFDSVRAHADKIIYVLGNHEFYHSDYQKALTIADNFCKEEGIYLMDEALGTDNLEIDGVTFWGSTLWSDLDNDDPIVKNIVGNAMNDFRVIDGLSVQDSVDINTRTREKINWDADVIITHHCPIILVHKDFPFSEITYGFCNTGLVDKIMDSSVKHWIYGHTHDSRNEDLRGTQVVSNQQGYPRTWGWDENFDQRMVIEVCGKIK